MRFTIYFILILFLSCGQNLADPSSDIDDFFENPNTPPPEQWVSFSGSIYFSNIYDNNSTIKSVTGQTGFVNTEFSLGNSYMPVLNDNDQILFASSNATQFVSIQRFDTRSNTTEIVLSENKNLVFPRATESGHRIVYVIDSDFDSLMYYDIASQTSTLLFPAQSSDQSIKGPVWNNSNTEVYFQLQVGINFNSSTIEKVDVSSLVKTTITQGAFPKLWTTNQRMIFAKDGAIWEINLLTNFESQITSTGLNSNANNPVYSPSGGQVAFSALHDGFFKIHIVDYNGSNLRRIDIGNFDSVYLEWVN